MWPVLLLCPQARPTEVTHTHPQKACLQTSLGGQCLRHNASTVVDMDRSLVGELKSPIFECGQKMEKTETKKKFIKKRKKHVCVTAQSLEEHSASFWLHLLAEPPVRFR